MMYMLLGGAILLLGLLIVLLGIKLLVGGNWLVGWLKGNLALLITALGIGLGWSALDLFSYQPLRYDQQLATIDFIKQGDNKYRMSLLQPNTKLFTQVVFGEKWQLSARVFQVSPQLLGFGMSPGFRLDKLAIQQGDKLSTQWIRQSEYGFDLWAVMNHLQWTEPTVITAHHISDWFEVTDKLSFAVMVTATGLKIEAIETEQ
ncbi:hypothetical protein H0A36_22260 [Endozoicomonas sp. SM1973]|uniref:Cation/multidrug efflux pump n=1 Tax=Spartinivicinus marinus TaxID=2994442 RepID=A0A853IFD2_9GAMM|nr:hypothetical protein [Spartinivicinus marinus]MCX4024793.1 hypothetical protein [Spartinivicinus marinus]NYZ68744.1 hypothetical protein [Spartinivicinus marinus]